MQALGWGRSGRASQVGQGCHTELSLRVLFQLCIGLSPGMREPAVRGVWFWTSQSEPDVEEGNRGASDQVLFSFPHR